MENSFGFGSEDVMEAITTTHLVLIVLFAILVILAIWWGTNRRRERRRAEREAHDRRGEASAAAEPDAVAPPVAPPPPPLADVPIPASAPQEANPAALAVDEDAEPAPAAPSAALGDGKVTMIKGLGPKVAARLAENGVTRVDQLAALSDDEAAVLDAKLGNFSGRMARDRWIEQARLLAAGDREGFEATFGKLG